MNLNIIAIKPFGVLVNPSGTINCPLELEKEYLIDLVLEHQLVVLRDFRIMEDSSQLIHFCERLKKISLWPFGEVLELIEHKNPSDHIFDHQYVPLHWDGMYRKEVPELQVFQCIKAPNDNLQGRTTFSNTKLALEKAPAFKRELWSRVTGSYQRKMEFYNSRTVAPIVVRHPYRDFYVIRYCEPVNRNDHKFINHPVIKFDGIKEGDLENFMVSLKEALYHEDCFYAHSWKEGDIVIADNFTLLHGRESFSKGSGRHLKRVHLQGQSALYNPYLEYTS